MGALDGAVTGRFASRERACVCVCVCVCVRARAFHMAFTFMHFARAGLRVRLVGIRKWSREIQGRYRRVVMRVAMLRYFVAATQRCAHPHKASDGFQTPGNQSFEAIVSCMQRLSTMTSHCDTIALPTFGSLRQNSPPHCRSLTAATSPG